LKRYPNDGLLIAKTWHRITKQERGEERRAERMLEYDAPTTGRIWARYSLLSLSAFVIVTIHAGRVWRITLPPW